MNHRFLDEVFQILFLAGRSNILPVKRNRVLCRATSPFIVWKRALVVNDFFLLPTAFFPMVWKKSPIFSRNVRRSSSLDVISFTNGSFFRISLNLPLTFTSIPTTPSLYKLHTTFAIFFIQTGMNSQNPRKTHADKLAHSVSLLVWDAQTLLDKSYTPL